MKRFLTAGTTVLCLFIIFAACFFVKIPIDWNDTILNKSENTYSEEYKDDLVESYPDISVKSSPAAYFESRPAESPENDTVSSNGEDKTTSKTTTDTKTVTTTKPPKKTTSKTAVNTAAEKTESTVKNQPESKTGNSGAYTTAPAAPDEALTANTTPVNTKDLGGETASNTEAGTTTTTTATTATTTTTTTKKEGEKNKIAYLTFDDGPSKNTVEIMKILDKYDVKATFFVIYHKGCDSIYRDIVNKGHTIALHSYSHNYKTIYSSEAGYFEDLTKLSDYVFDLTGERSKVIRFPGGSSNTVSKSYKKGIMTSLSKQVVEQGYSYFDWNVDSGDASASVVASDKIVKNIRNGIKNKNRVCILMHDTAKKTTTVDALPEIIDILLEEGYDIRPLTENTSPIRHSIRN